MKTQKRWIKSVIETARIEAERQALRKTERGA